VNPSRKKIGREAAGIGPEHSQLTTRFLSILTLCLPFLIASVTQAQTMTGFYEGNSVPGRSFVLNYQPDLVLIKRIAKPSEGGSGGSEQAAEITIATDTMTSGEAFTNDSLTNQTIKTGLIDSLDATGFTVSASPEVNQTGTEYIWIASKQNAAFLYTGTFTGDDTASQAITGVGFQPDVLWMWEAEIPVLYHNGSTTFSPNQSTADECWIMGENKNLSNCLLSLDTDGFTVGDGPGGGAPDPNSSAFTWHYVAFKNDTGNFNSGSYNDGDGSASKVRTVSGLDPDLVFVTSQTTTSTYGTNFVIKDAISEGQLFSRTWGGPLFLETGIIAMGTTSFTVGSSSYVNEAGGAEYYWMAFPASEPTAVKMEWMQATRFAEGSMVQWRSGFETNNLGYRIFAVDRNGRRTLLTPSVIAGSSLFVGATTRLTAGRSYSWWHKHRSGKAPYAYALEAIDLDWKRRIVTQVYPQLAGAEDLPPTSDTPKLDRVGHPPQGRVLAPGLLKGRNRLTAKEIRSLSRRWFMVADTAQPPPGSALPSQFAAFFPERQEVFADSASQDLCKGAPSSAAHAKQWEIAAKRSVKIGVDQTGWVSVPQTALLNSDLSATLDPRNLQLFVDGNEIPMLVRGEADGSFDAADGIEFYGISLDTASTDTRVYWLVLGDSPGKRLPTLDVEPASSGFSQNNIHTVETKPRTVYLSALNNGDAGNFFGPLISSEPVALSLEAPAVDDEGSEDALLEIGLQGLTKIKNHAIKIVVNGAMVGTVSFRRQSRVVGRIAIPHHLLQSGENVVQLLSTGNPSDKSFVDFLRLTYDRLYQANGGAYRFVASGGEAVKITGLGQAPARFVEITDPRDPQLLTLPTTGQPSDGISVTLPGAGTGTFILVSEAGKTKAKYVKVNIPSKWNAQSNAAQLLIVADNEIYPSAVDLQEHRRNQGWDVSTLDIEDIYDEFTFGHKDPWAIRCLTHWAQRTWAETPNYLLLFGDASFDRRNYLGLGDRDKVPTKLVHGAFLETASDDWFGNTDGSAGTDMAIGRLPAQDSGEADGIVKKLIAYDEADVDPSWSKRAAFIADLKFANQSDSVRSLLPEDWSDKQILYDKDNVQSRSKDLLAELNRGQAVVNYFGHGSVSVWSGGDLFSTNDALSLKNESRLPIVFAMTCLNGFFQDVYTHSLAEGLMVAENGGAIAVFASSELEYPTQHTLISAKLLDVITNEKVETLGAAAMKVKRDIGGSQRQTWIFFGDPTTSLKGWAGNGPGGPIAPDGPTGPPGCGCEMTNAWDVAPALVLLVILFVWRRTRRKRLEPKT